MFKKILLVSLVGLSLVGCKSTPKPTDPVKLVPIEASKTISKKWATQIGKTDTLAFSPYYFQGAVYAANEKGMVYEFDYSSGNKLLEFNTNTKLVAGVAATENLIYVGTQDAKLLAFDKTNKQKAWEQALSATLSEAPVLVGNILVTKSKDGRLSGFDSNTGQTLWTFANTQSELTIRHMGTIRPLDAQLFITALPGGRLGMFDAQTGNQVWGVIVATAKGTSDLERVTEVLSRPILTDDQICAATYQGRVTCFNLQTGATVWAQPTSSSQGIDAWSNLLVLTETNGTVKAFNRNNGQLLWQNTDLKNRKVSAPTILSDGILVTDFEGYGHLIDFQTGSIIGREKLGIGSLTAQPISLENNVLLQGQKGDLTLVYTGNKK